ncbi:hypothetical protein Q8F55_004782 [Vanrija albida]|uniref:SCP domain-containing protein n=1 Tax=Vanrija albida TaxID=181172 RepID=A0ABR3PZR3_9TREE
MKFSPLVLLALATAVSAAPAPPKCRPKTHAGNSSPAIASSDASASSTASTAVPSSAGHSSAATTAASSPVVSGSLSSSVEGTPTANSTVPTSSPADGAASSSAEVTSAPTSSPSPVDSSTSSSAAPLSSGIPEGNANPNPGYKPPSTLDEKYFLDESVKPVLPKPIGPEPAVNSIVFPPGSVGINPDGAVPASDPIAQTFLSRFNDWRSVWGAPPLTWNETFSATAVDAGKKCQYQHFMAPGVFGQIMDGGQGEWSAVDFDYQAKLSVDRWMVEGKEYDYGTHSAKAGKDIGHWQAITNPLYTQVGCGWRSCGNIYCDFNRDFEREWAEKIPEYKEHVYPRIEVPWDDYKDAFWQRR